MSNPLANTNAVDEIAEDSGTGMEHRNCDYNSPCKYTVAPPAPAWGEALRDLKINMRNPLARAGVGLVPSQEVWSQTLSRATNAKSRQFPRLHLSPNRILALRLRSKNDDQKQRYRGPFRLAASLRSGRLPIMTLQTWLARQDLTSEKGLAKSMAAKKEADWRDAFNSLAGRGWSRRQFDHWIWILSGENGDVRAQRLVSTGAPNPIFLLLLLLRNDESYRQAESLTSLIRYAAKHHMVLTPALYAVQDPSKILAVSQFLIMMRRLIHHVQNVHPQSIVTVARLAVDYIKSIPNDPHHKHHRTDYRDQCVVYNTALFCLRKPASNQPLVNMEFNWRAQKVLLTMSNGLEKSLIINKASYQAIRQVLVGLKKSGEERAVALRYAKSWPPYRQDFDGRDTKRTAEDDMSRSAKAGVLMKEAGYPENHYDRALDALGGMSEGSPTIQTRSLPPMQWTGKKEDLNLYSNWAMNIRATRNAQEAWRAFNKFAEKTGMAPNLQVYTEMFLKLQAMPVDPDSGSDLLPGDSRETFPVHNANYSQYELARLSPPTLSELYAEMVSRGIKPGGHGLHNLIIHAKSVDEGLRYLQDSGIPYDIIKSIDLFRQPSYRALRRIPLLCFSSYIQLLCRLQPDRRGRDKLFIHELYRIRHAIKLVEMRLTPNTTEGATFRPPWYAILRALARAHIAVRNGPAAENDLEALTLFMETFRTVRSGVGIDAELFMLLCRVIQKAALSRLSSLSDMERAKAPLLPHTQDLLDLTTSIFSQLTTPIVEELSTSLPIPQFQFPLGPPHLHAYMRALGFLEAKDEMASLVFWMIDNYGYLTQEADRLSTRGQAMIAKTLCAFRAFGGPALEESVQHQLINRMSRLIADGGYWRWPTSEELENYVYSDASGGSETLRRRIMIRCTEERPSCKRCLRLHHVCTYGNGPLPKRSSRPATEPAVSKDAPSQPTRNPPRGHTTQASLPQAQRRPVLTQPSGTGGSKQYIGLLEHLLPELVDIYFNYVYNAHLLLHKRSFLESVVDGTACIHVVLSICAWGAKFYEDASRLPVLKDQGFMLEWAQSAGKLVFQEVEELARGNIVTYMNLALFWHSQGARRRAYLYKGHAFLLLDLLGLGPKSLYTENSLQSEIRRRHFWACYVMHCHTSEKGAQFKLEGDTSKLPLPWSDEDFDTGLARNPPVSLDSEESNGSVFAELIKATTIWYSVVSLLKDPEKGLQTRVPAILALDERLQKWWQTLPSKLKLTPDNVNSIPRATFTRIIHINALYHQSLCALHASLVPVFCCSPGGGWSATRQLSAQIAFEHAVEMSSLIAAILEATPRTSGIPMFMGYAAYCGCAIQIPFMWSSKAAFKERIRANIRANSKLLQLMTADWKFASTLSTYIHYLHNLHSRREMVLEDEPRNIAQGKLTCFNGDASDTHSSIFEYIAMLRTEGGGYGGSDENSEHSEHEALGGIATDMPNSQKLIAKNIQEGDRDFTIGQAVEESLEYPVLRMISFLHIERSQ
ncbi:hypothetical protein F5B21DRAFT_504148 [Xylaria acuta]|nr:hypothetical protein F5B21DRAFT_504148 [Xylaria acuta]